MSRWDKIKNRVITEEDTEVDLTEVEVEVIEVKMEVTEVLEEVHTVRRPHAFKKVMMHSKMNKI